MTKSYKENAPISVEQLTNELMRLKRGSVTRRHFLGVTGLGLASAVLAHETSLFSTPTPLPQDLGTQMSIATWPNYHDPATFEAFTASDRRCRRSQCLRLQRGNAGQAAGRRHRLGSVRADQLHDLDLCQTRPDRPARSGESCPTTTPTTGNGALHHRRRGRRHDLCRAEKLGNDRHRPQLHEDQDARHELEGLLRGCPGRGRRPRHGARLSADDDRQCAGLARLFLQFG